MNVAQCKSDIVDIAVSVVNDYMSLNPFCRETPDPYDKKVFSYHSYAKWTANEIIERIFKQDDVTPPWDFIDPVDIIVGFIDEISSYLSECPDDSDAAVMLTAVIDTATDILRMFL